MTNLYLSALKTIISRYPVVIPHLKGRARWVAFSDQQANPIYKTYDFFLNSVERLIRSVYNGNLGGQFIDVMANLISGQLNQAFEQAWKDEGTEGDVPDYLTSAAEDMILGQYDFVDGLYKDIVNARVDDTGVDALLARAPLWANRWNEAYNMGIHLIQVEMGGKEIWKLGDTEKHCSSCSALNGIVAYASEWDQLDVHPQGAPNDKLQCGGWQCDCSREPTDQRRSPKAFDTIMNIVSK